MGYRAIHEGELRVANRIERVDPEGVRAPAGEWRSEEEPGLSA